jgi:hypothetical protein
MSLIKISRTDGRGHQRGVLGNIGGLSRYTTIGQLRAYPHRGSGDV